MPATNTAAAWVWLADDESFECASWLEPGDVVLAEGLEVQFRLSDRHGWSEGTVYDVAFDAAHPWRLRRVLVRDASGDVHAVSLRDVRPDNWRELCADEDDSADNRDCPSCSGGSCVRCVGDWR